MIVWPPAAQSVQIQKASRWAQQIDSHKINMVSEGNEYWIFTKNEDVMRSIPQFELQETWVPSRRTKLSQNIQNRKSQSSLNREQAKAVYNREIIKSVRSSRLNRNTSQPNFQLKRQEPSLERRKSLKGIKNIEDIN